MPSPPVYPPSATLTYTTGAVFDRGHTEGVVGLSPSPPSPHTYSVYIVYSSAAFNWISSRVLQTLFFFLFHRYSSSTANRKGSREKQTHNTWPDSVGKARK